MKLTKSILFYFYACCCSVSATAQYIIVDDTYTAQNLVDLLTNNSNCVTTSSAIASGDSFSGSKNSYGYFSAGTSSFPFAEGILLSTWSGDNSIGPFVRNQGGGDTSWLGDRELENALGITNTKNATILEFDFKPLTNFISFDYIFASDEYQDYFPCRFSDGFAFLIKENGGSGGYANLAVLPNTTIPISSMNVHPLISYTPAVGGTIECDAENEEYFEQFNTATANSSPINYAGQTKVLTATTNVIAGNSYHIKLVIADAGQDGAPNVNYDSGVFLKAGSFSSKIDLGQDRLITENNPICFGETITVSTNLPGTHHWTKTDSMGTTTLTETSSSLVIQNAGIYNVEATVSSCTVTGKIKIEYAPELILKDVSLTRCENKYNGNTVFDLSKTEDIIKNGDSSLTTITFYETQTGNILSDLITNPTTFTKTSSADQLIYAKVTSKTYECTETAKITLKTITTKLSTSTLAKLPIINDFSANENSIQLIPPTTGGLYMFSLDGTNYQSSPLFTNLAVGSYLAYIQDSETCEYLSYSIIILDYPRYFTPNNDGFNDSWNIKNLALFPKSTVTIYDRYGKLLKQLNSSNNDWNGSFNGSEMPSDDYWFSLNLDDGRIIKGHFSLKR